MCPRGAVHGIRWVLFVPPEGYFSLTSAAERTRLERAFVIHGKDGAKREVPVLLRIDTPIEVDYYLHGGILPYVLRDLVRHAA